MNSKLGLKLRTFLAVGSPNLGQQKSWARCPNLGLFEKQPIESFQQGVIGIGEIGLDRLSARSLHVPILVLDIFENCPTLK